MMKLVVCFSLALAFLSSSSTFAENIFTIGYLELKKDARYKKKRLQSKFTGQALGRPFAGAEIALKEVKFHGSEIDTSFKLERKKAKDSKQLDNLIEEFLTEGVRFIVLDLPSAELIELTNKNNQRDITFFNISSYDDSLRNEFCQANLYHTLPSHTMLMDGLTQYLVSKKWRKILLLESELEQDKLISNAFEKSSKRYGLKIIEKRPFVIGNDPRERSKNNVALITGGKHDIIYIADSNGEFARSLPYQTVKPSLVVGSEGLSASTWHWSWERHGAPQLVKRFKKKHNREMAGTDWAAWMAVKAIAGAVQGSRTTDYKQLKAFLTSPDNILDTFKGNASNFRPWNNQLRQPILITTHNWVVAKAPIKGFLHQKNNLDTLGNDKRNSKCSYAE